MFVWFLRPLRFLAQAFGSDDSPRQLALGLSLGMMIGLMPKDNLTVAALSLLLFATRVNLATGALAAFVFSWVGVWTDPAANRIGWYLLSLPALQGFWTTLADLPIIPWTSFNNSVVLGSFVMGLWLWGPVYLAATPLFVYLQPRVTARLRRFKVYQLLMGTELASHWRIG